MARRWPRAVGTGPSSCGTWPPARPWAILAGHRHAVPSVAFSPEARRWPRAVRTRPSSCGTWPQVSPWATLTGHADRCRVVPSAPMARRWLRAVGQDYHPVGCGHAASRWRPSPGHSGSVSESWLSVPMARRWPRAVGTRPSSCGMWPRASPWATLAGHTAARSAWPSVRRQDAGVGQWGQHSQAVGCGHAGSPWDSPGRATGLCMHVAFSPDGKTLASGSGDNDGQAVGRGHTPPLGDPRRATRTLLYRASPSAPMASAGLGQWGQRPSGCGMSASSRGSLALATSPTVTSLVQSGRNILGISSLIGRHVRGRVAD